MSKLVVILSKGVCHRDMRKDSLFVPHESIGDVRSLKKSNSMHRFASEISLVFWYEVCCSKIVQFDSKRCS